MMLISNSNLKNVILLPNRSPTLAIKLTKMEFLLILLNPSYSIIPSAQICSTAPELSWHYGLFRKFIKGYAHIISPLNALLKKSVKFELTPQCQEAFEKFKHALVNPPVLAYPNVNKQFAISSDASGNAIGYVLEQADDGANLHPIAFGGRALQGHGMSKCYRSH